MTAAKVEFAVQMKCDSCVEKIRKCLTNVDGISKFDVSLKDESVVLETTLPTSEILEKLESTGCRAVLKGYGGGVCKTAAVAMVGNDCGRADGHIKGVIRFLQLDNDTCVIDGTIDGLEPGKHGIHVYECGDISDGCESLGGHYNPQNTTHGGPLDDAGCRHAGDLGNISANSEGRAVFRFTDSVLKVSDVIGRSVAVTDSEDDLGRGNNAGSLEDGNAGRKIACGIIARSAGLFENTKRICACDGVTLWDERDVPLAGPGRRTAKV
ncbi:copper chaperone for superoxide dismutase [Schistocerca americana]|uniref:copper chaperone for superoxide dismutase n=1 Tax=Schistocerca americana TaxID=7009 RepID=UPI001F4F4D56|nr:copper chaperone for superoxide dismutase [Schistocerca americana]